MFPIISCEHFFPDPQKIVNYSETLEYFPAEANQYPGVRSDTIYNIDQNLDRYVGNRILRNFYHSNNWSNYNNVNWNAEIRFHKIRPLHEDQYHIKNRDRRLVRRKELYVKNRDEINAKQRAKRQRKKLEKQERLQGVGTLEPYMG